jgi:hypothetical protein
MKGSKNKHPDLESLADETSKRKWHDHKDRVCKTEPFSTEEIERLKQSLCRYAAQHNISEEQLLEYMAKSFKWQRIKIWCKIAEDFPDRRVQDVQTMCKRRFNPNNYKGKWTEEEERQFVKLVESEGHAWRKIGDILGRTDTNCRDKWRELGGRSRPKKTAAEWSIGDSLKLIQLIQKAMKFPIIENVSLNEIEKEFKKKLESQNLSKEDVGSKPYNDLRRGIFDEHLSKSSMEKLKKLKIPWSNIEKAFIGKSRNDLKNHWRVQIVGEYRKQKPLTRLTTLGLLQWIQENKITSESQIDWKDIGDKCLRCWKKLKTSIPMTGNFTSYVQECLKVVNKNAQKKYETLQNDADSNPLSSVFKSMQKPKRRNLHVQVN